MFDVLRSIQSDVATEAVYRIGLRIYEREYFQDWRRWLPLRPNDHPAPEALAAATQVLEEIERRAGKPLGQLDDAEIEPYRRKVHRIMDQRRARERTVDPAVAQRILEEMRRDYGGHRAVA